MEKEGRSGVEGWGGEKEGRRRVEGWGGEKEGRRGVEGWGRKVRVEKKNGEGRRKV